MSNLDNIMEELLNKYEQGRCSVEEIAVVEEHLAQMEKDYIPGYGDLRESIDQTAVEIDVESLINKRNEEMESKLKRFEQGESDLEEIKVVESFLSDQNRIKIPFYQDFILAERQVKFGTEVSSIIETMELEALLQAYEEGSISDKDLLRVESMMESISASDIPEYQSFIDQEKSIVCNIDVLHVIEPEAKVVPFGSNNSWRQWGMIAASLVFVLAAIFVLKPNGENTTLASEDHNTIEIEDADEALEFTLAALGLTSKKMKKGTDNMKHLKDLRHTQIYK